MNYYFKRGFTFLLMYFLLLGCTSPDEEGLKDSRPEFMLELKKTLTEKNIPFEKDTEGYIRYSGTYRAEVEKAKLEIDNQFRNEVGTKYEDKISTDYLRRLLKEKSIEYRVETRDGNEWTYWIPENANQQQEIEMQVVNCYFDKQQEANID